MSMRNEDMKASKPCFSYWGNVCSGFGAPTICLGCGWDRDEHQSEMSATLKQLRGLT